MNFSPSDGLNGEPDLLSLSGQTISLKLKFPRTWTEGGGGGVFNFFNYTPVDRASDSMMAPT